MNQFGFTITFGGPDFQPEEFLRDSALKPLIVHRGDILRNGGLAEESWLEFVDLRDGSYPLDAATEALDFLRSRSGEFVRLSRFSGVVTRTLNFFGDADSCSMELEPADIALLHELSIHLSICVHLHTSARHPTMRPGTPRQRD
jgi:hypothetical protein